MNHNSLFRPGWLCAGGIKFIIIKRNLTLQSLSAKMDIKEINFSYSLKNILIPNDRELSQRKLNLTALTCHSVYITFQISKSNQKLL